MWHNSFEYLDFGQEHPFDTLSKFLHCFSDFDQSYQIQYPSERKLRLLQKFLQPILVARPSRILKLKECKKYRVPFNLHPTEEALVRHLASEYLKKSGMNSSYGVLKIGIDDSQIGVFGLAVKVQMTAFHPLLAAEIENIVLKDFEHGEMEEAFQDLVEEDYGGAKLR